MCFLQEVLTVNIFRPDQPRAVPVPWFWVLPESWRCRVSDSARWSQHFYPKRENIFIHSEKKYLCSFNYCYPLLFLGVGSVHRPERGVRAGRGRDREAVRQHPLKPGRGNDGRNIQIFYPHWNIFIGFRHPGKIGPHLFGDGAEIEQRWVSWT